jgi:hypothetical protein
MPILAGIDFLLPAAYTVWQAIGHCPSPTGRDGAASRATGLYIAHALADDGRN